ncbi:hypothetical protein KIPB_014276, partial [Kipferlia bialata]|eukprot:g14276.t1
MVQVVRHTAATSCILPLMACHGRMITTVEGLEDTAGPVYDRVRALHASQCGYCTPGIVVSLVAYLLENPNPTCHDIEHSFSANLCRCTGYRPILDMAKTFAVDLEDVMPEATATGVRLSSFKNLNVHALKEPCPFPPELKSGPIRDLSFDNT